MSAKRFKADDNYSVPIFHTGQNWFNIRETLTGSVVARHMVSEPDMRAKGREDWYRHHHKIAQAIADMLNQAPRDQQDHLIELVEDAKPANFLSMPEK